MAVTRMDIRTKQNLSNINAEFVDFFAGLGVLFSDEY